MIDAVKLESFFSQFLAERGVVIDKQSLRNFNFMQSGLLDSFEMLSMVMQLETTYSVTLTPEQMLSDDCATVGGLIKVLVES